MKRSKITLVLGLTFMATQAVHAEVRATGLGIDAFRLRLEEKVAKPEMSVRTAQGRHSCNAYPWYVQCKREPSRSGQYRGEYCCTTIKYDVPNCTCD